MTFAEAQRLAELALAKDIKTAYFAVEDAKSRLELIHEVLQDSNPEGDTAAMLETALADLDTIGSDLWNVHGVSDVAFQNCN